MSSALVPDLQHPIQSDHPQSPIMTNAKEIEEEKTRGVKNDEDRYPRLKLNKLTNVVMTKFESLYPSNTLRPDLRNHIEQCICMKFRDLHTPDHPTYALMIRRAIEELGEEKGSTEEAISKFIVDTVEDLPWSHRSFLSHHLSQLCESGDIVKVSENCYMLPVENTNSLPKRGLRKKRKRRHYQGSEAGKQRKVEEGYQLEEKQVLKEDKQSQNLGIEVNGELNGAHRHQSEEIEDQNRSQELQIELVGEQRQEKQQIDVTDQQRSTEDEQQFQVNDKQNLVQGERDKESEEDEKDEQQQIEATEEQIQQDGRQIIVTENQNRAHRHQIEENEDKSELEECQFQEIEEKKQEVTDKQSHAEEQLINVDEELNQAHGQQSERLGDEKQLEKGQTEVPEEPSQAQGRHTKVIEQQTAADGQPIEEFTGRLSGGQHIEVIEEQKPADQKMDYEKWVAHGQLNEEITDYNVSKGQGIEVTKEQMPAEQPIEQEPRVNGTEDRKQAEEQCDVLVEQIVQVQQLEVIGKHNEAKQHKVELIEEQNKEQKGDVIVERYLSQVQQNKQQDELSSQQGQTQRHEIEVIVEERIGIVEKNKVTGEQIQEERVHDLIQDQCQRKVQQSEPIEEQNLLHNHIIEDIQKQIQLQEEKILGIENLIEPEAQKNEVIEEKNDPQTEMRSNMIGLSDLHSSKEPEKDKAIVTTQSSLTSQRLDNEGSLLTSKAECIELLKRTKEIQEELMDKLELIMREMSKDDTLKPVMEEQVEEILKEPEQQQIGFSNPKRPPEIEVETLPELFRKRRKKLNLCGQREVPKGWPKPTRTSPDVLANSEQLENEQQPELGNSDRGLELDLPTMEAQSDRQEESRSKISINLDSRQLEMEKQLDLPEGHPEICSQQKPLECFPFMSSLTPLHSEELELAEQQGLHHSERPAQFKSSTTLDPSCQKQQQATLCGMGKEHERQQLEQESQLENSIHERPVELEQVCERQQPSRGQRQRKLQSRAPRALVSDCVEAEIPECQVQNPLEQPTQGQQQQRQLRHRGPRPSESDSGKMKEPKCQDEQPENRIQERPIELEPATLNQSGQTLPQTSGQLQQRKLRPRGQQLSNSSKSTALESQIKEEQKLNPQGQGVVQNKLCVDNTKTKLLPSQHQHELQQLQRKGRGRLPKSNPDVTAMGKLLPSDDKHHNKQQPPEGRGLGRPRGKKKDKNQTTRLLVPTAQQNQCEQQQLECRGQSRQLRPRDKDASQPKLAINDTIKKFPSKHQHEQQHPLKHKGRGRPPKLKSDLDVGMKELLPSGDQQQQQAECQGQVKRCTPKAREDAVMQVSIPLDHQNHNELPQQEQPPEKRGRGRPRGTGRPWSRGARWRLGRPPKPKPALVTTMDVLLPSQQQEQPQNQGQGRPPKRKLDADSAKEEPLNSENQQQKPKRRGRGRPRKVG